MEPHAKNPSRNRLVAFGSLPITATFLVILMAPDLAVEVASPSDSAREIQEKVADWLRAGTRLVWVIYPATRSATVHVSQDQFEELSEEGTLLGDDVIPGFTCKLSEIFS